MARERICGLCVVVLLLAACASDSGAQRARAAVQAGSYREALEMYEREAPHEPALLVGIASAILERDALAGDEPTRRAAFVELGAAGHRARRVLEELAAREDAPQVRALALAALTRLGDARARSQLRALLDDQDPAIADLAHGALDPSDHDDLSRALAALSSARAERRLAALQVLARASFDADVAAALSERSRIDPLPAARAAALSALAGQGAAATESVERALDDTDENVRSTAIAVLPRLDLVRAERALSKWLDGELRPESLEAARALLLERPGTETDRARRTLALGLESSNARLRAHAAVAVRGLPPALRDHDVVRSRLSRESDAAIRLQLALALGPSDSAAAGVLKALASSASVEGVQAALELARTGDANALATLRARRTDSSAAIRRSAARALALDLAHPDDARALLADPDPAVRRAAAAALLPSD